jgi:hypothetical protein
MRALIQKHPIRHQVIRLIALGCALAWPAQPAIAGPAPPTIRLIAASTTDPAIDDVIGVHHVAIGHEASRNGHLLVYFPGTTASAQDYTQLIERTAVLGYHAIGLAYQNANGVNALCFGQPADCQERVRQEIIYGTDETTLVDVDFDNSIMNRLDRLLSHLEGVAPDEGWDAYRDAAGEVRWQSVVLSGHSQGAGHAAFISRFERIARAVLFSGTEPAAWTQLGDFVTPAADIYGFAHRLEPIYSPIQLSWDNIGLPGTPVSVDALAPPFVGSRQLFSLIQTCLGDPAENGFYHNCHCVEGWMPPALPDGTPHFQYTWDHLFQLESAPPVPAMGPAATGLLTLALIGFGARSLPAPRSPGRSPTRDSAADPDSI